MFHGRVIEVEEICSINIWVSHLQCCLCRFQVSLEGYQVEGCERATFNRLADYWRMLMRNVEMNDGVVGYGWGSNVYGIHCSLVVTGDDDVKCMTLYLRWHRNMLDEFMCSYAFVKAL